MADEWYYRTTQGDFGPVSMTEVVGLIRDGKLQRNDQIRASRSVPWQTVAEWVRQGPEQPSSVRMTPSPSGLAEAIREATQNPSREASDKPTLREWLLEREQLTVLLGIAIGLFVIGELWWFLTPKLRRFPNPERVTFTVETPSLLEQCLPRSPGDSQNAAEPEGEPEPLPGLESVANARTPTLTPDRLDLVFVAPYGDGDDPELFHCQRTSRSEPFGAPQRLETVAEAQHERFPTLAPDGLEVIFCVEESLGSLYSRVRPDRMTPFGAAEPVVINGLEERFVVLDEPQFLQENELKFAAGTEDGSVRRHYVATRGERGKGFQVASSLEFDDRTSRYFVTAQRRRAYSLTPTGLFVTAQPPLMDQFLPSQAWLYVNVMGPSGGRDNEIVWVSPEEDEIVFCSTGAGGPRRMLRLPLK